MKQVNIVTCPLCGDTTLKGKAVCTDHYATGEQFTLCRCAHCGFVFTQSFPDESVIGRYYDVPEYISHSDTRRGIINKLYHVARSIMLRRKVRLVERVSGLHEGRLLDIGSGTGYFAYRMQEDGWTVQAAEKSEKARDYGLKKFGFQAITPQDLDNLPDGSQDVITMFHVMEHVQGLREEWKLIYRLLSAEGHLILAVPNSKSADADYYGPDWAAYDVPRHLWHFTPESLQTIAEQEGFELEEILPMPFDAFYVSMLTEKYRGHRRTACLRGFLRGIICTLRSLADKHKSSSLIYVFHKK